MELQYQQWQLEEGPEAYVSLPSLNGVTANTVSFGIEFIARFKMQRKESPVAGNLELVIDEPDSGYLLRNVEM